MTYTIQLKWQDQAACQNMNPEVFFNIEQQELAKQTCLKCPVILACGDYILGMEKGLPAEYRHGIYAGMLPEDRAKTWAYRTLVKLSRKGQIQSGQPPFITAP
jgi:Transcription factor WhiB